MSFSAITRQIWVGPELNNPLDSATDPQDVSIVKALLATVDPDTIIDCRKEYDDAKLLQKAGFLTDSEHYLFDGIQDFTSVVPLGAQPIPDWFFTKALTFWMPKQLNRSAVVYVHCTQGINRSATLAYAFMLAQGKPREEALALLNLHRPVTLINDILDRPWREQAEEAARTWLASAAGVAYLQAKTAKGRG